MKIKHIIARSGQHEYKPSIRIFIYGTKSDRIRGPMAAYSALWPKLSSLSSGGDCFVTRDCFYENRPGSGKVYRCNILIKRKGDLKPPGWRWTCQQTVQAVRNYRRRYSNNYPLYADKPEEI